MSNYKPLPEWVHAEIRRRERIHGAQKPLYYRAKIRPETFKLLCKRGWGKADVVDRVVKVIEDDIAGPTVTGKQIVSHIDTKRDVIMATVPPGSPGRFQIPRMLAVFIMRKDAGMDRRTIANEIGYRSLTSVNNAEKDIYAEMDSNRAFRKVVYEIKAELGY